MQLRSSAARRTGRRAGVATVEFALTLPIFLILLVGIWEVGRLIELQQLIVNSAREGARQAASGKYTTAQIQADIHTYLTNAGLPITDANGNPNVTVTALDVTSGNVPLSPSSYSGAVIPQMHHVHVSVAYPMDNARLMTSGGFNTKNYGLVGLGTFVPAGTMLNATSDWYVMSDVPITVPTTIPNAPLQ